MLSFLKFFFFLYNFEEPKFVIVRNQFYIKLYRNNNFCKIIDISRNFFFFLFLKLFQQHHINSY